MFVCLKDREEMADWVQKLKSILWKLNVNMRGGRGGNQTSKSLGSMWERKMFEKEVCQISGCLLDAVDFFFLHACIFILHFWGNGLVSSLAINDGPPQSSLSIKTCLSPLQLTKRFPATLSSTASIRFCGVSAWTATPPLSAAGLASELCSSPDKDGLRASPPAVPLSEAPAGGQGGASSLSGLGKGEEVGYKGQRSAIAPHQRSQRRSAFVRSVSILLMSFGFGGWNVRVVLREMGSLENITLQNKSCHEIRLV